MQAATEALLLVSVYVKYNAEASEGQVLCVA
jgi:hypothetical protein